MLVSVNRLSDLTLGFVAPNEFLRWVDLNNMVLGLVTVLLTYLTYQHLLASTDRRGAARRSLGLTFVVGAYLYATSYGSHEITNYLHGRFCPDTPDDLCRIVAFNDDEFSHYLFFAGFLLLNLVVLLAQVTAPDRDRLSIVDWVLLTANALFVGAGVVANLAFEQIGLDLYVVAAVAVLSVILLWRQRLQPILYYYVVAFVLGLLVTAILKLT
ncbi:hypothetical protein [Micromonospora avicenniae]|uniref:hypothetical protein n=1 Tax=Micromonospora avicenniae TaxID=1198245 RepID=UPI000970B9D8|nr:hypothetical protein [Micromonospora avicenniae]